MPDLDAPRYLILMDGRELVGTITGIGRDWHALDARGKAVPSAPFNSQKAAIAALSVARPGPCVADARMDNRPGGD